MSGKSILIIEDDEDIQLIYRKMIEDTFDGLDIRQCANGREGLEAVLKQRPDLIILDLLMPVMDGEAFLKTLRHELKIGDVPVVICSVNQPLAQKLLKQKEADAVLPKIFPIEAFAKVFEDLAGIRPKKDAPGL